MNIRQFEVFLAVMEHASVTRSAEKLFISPGAVSLQLHGLAAELGTELDEKVLATMKEHVNIKPRKAPR